MKRYGIALLVVVSLVACNGSSGGKPTGSEGGPCYGDGTCDGTLTCVSEVCVDLSELNDFDHAVADEATQTGDTVPISDEEDALSDEALTDLVPTDEDVADVFPDSDSADEEIPLPDEDLFECADGAVETAGCGDGSVQRRRCEGGYWSEWSSCLDITAEVMAIAAESSCADYYWKDRGHAPLAYMKGMALVFAGAVCHADRSDVLLVSEAKTSDLEHDALAWYDEADIFSDLGMSNDIAGLDTLRHAYTLLLGLGMRESSGEHCCGRDMSATNVTADTAEAGLFQTSYNSHIFSDKLDTLYEYWKALWGTGSEKCLLTVFSEGVTCSPADWENYGVGEGVTFQQLEKECPIFAAEYAAVMLRVSGGSKGHYGPLRRREAEVRPECDAMFAAVQTLIEEHRDFCPFLVNY